MLVDQMRDGGHHARLVENRRPHTADQSPRFEVRLTQHGLTCFVGPGRLGGPRVFQVGVRLKLHDRAGELLGQAIVNFIGYGLPVVIARL